MKKIVLFGAGKSSTCLIDYLLHEAMIEDWQLTVADGHLASGLEKIGDSKAGIAVEVNVNNSEQRKPLVLAADIVISLLPPALHFLVAQDCIEFNKHLLTASYVDEKIGSLRGAIADKSLLFLCEMGLDPGIDHMSAMQLIHQIKSEGGVIQSFRSHTGGLVAPESDDNPWHYKISWNPRNIVMAGSAGATFLEKGAIVNMPYAALFDACPTVSVPGLEPLAYYPNRDSLAYIPVYGLEETSTFIRTTLRNPLFCENWKWMVKSGLTDDRNPVQTNGLSFNQWSAPLLSKLPTQSIPLFQWLGMFDDSMVPAAAKTNADILQFLLESKWIMRPKDKDMIVMLHEIDYDLNGHSHALKSSLIVKGENSVRTAMAKTVGLPLGIAAKLILQQKIKLSGLHIPILPEIYEPVLAELKNNGITFTESVS